MITFQEYLTEVKTRSRIRDWVVQLSKHAVERINQRREDLSQQDWKTVYREIVNKVEENNLSGEILFYSKKFKQGLVVAVNAVKNMIKVITTLPKGKQFAKPGTEKVIVEGRVFEQVIYLDDDED